MAQQPAMTRSSCRSSPPTQLAADCRAIPAPLVPGRHVALQPALVAAFDKSPRHASRMRAAVVAARLRVLGPRGLHHVVPAAVLVVLPTALGVWATHEAADCRIVPAPLVTGRHVALQPALVAPLDKCPRHTIRVLVAAGTARVWVLRPRGLHQVTAAAVLALRPGALPPRRPAQERRPVGVRRANARRLRHRLVRSQGGPWGANTGAVAVLSRRAGLPRSAGPEAATLRRVGAHVPARASLSGRAGGGGPPRLARAWLPSLLHRHGAAELRRLPRRHSRHAYKQQGAPHQRLQENNLTAKSTQGVRDVRAK
mmetsp:Transcript_40476/g.107258  ORF Transcript_40476/g.107258 Transcript_40476/m.107258 type:complete len:312 (+) Transcript_40476:211-1146(+)